MTIARSQAAGGKVRWTGQGVALTPAEPMPGDRRAAPPVDADAFERSGPFDVTAIKDWLINCNPGGRLEAITYLNSIGARLSRVDALTVTEACFPDQPAEALGRLLQRCADKPARLEDSACRALQRVLLTSGGWKDRFLIVDLMKTSGAQLSPVDAMQLARLCFGGRTGEGLARLLQLCTDDPGQLDKAECRVLWGVLSNTGDWRDRFGVVAAMKASGARLSRVDAMRLAQACFSGRTSDGLGRLLELCTEGPDLLDPGALATFRRLLQSGGSWPDRLEAVRAMQRSGAQLGPAAAVELAQTCFEGRLLSGFSALLELCPPEARRASRAVTSGLAQMHRRLDPKDQRALEALMRTTGLGDTPGT